MSSSHLRTPESTPLALKPALLSGALAFVVTFALFTFFWAIWINPYYFPYADNFSIFVNSTPPFHPSVSSWFLHGFQTYFDVYPDMSLHSSNFIRPVVNGTFFLGWFAYGAHWSRYLLTSYAIIGLIAATTFFLAGHILKLGWRLTLLATVCAAIAPSVDSAVIFDPTFAFDLLGGLLVLMGVASLISDALVLAWLLFTLAIFTKETTLFAPAVAAVIVFFRKKDEQPLLQRVAASAAFLLPLAGWMILRRHNFHGEKGVYVFMEPSSHGPIHVMLARIILGLTHWPIATTVYWGSIPLAVSVLGKASLLINLVFWPTLAVILIKKLAVGYKRLAEPLRARGEWYASVILALFCAGSLLLPIALDSPRRFGGVFYPLFILCLASATRYANSSFLRTASAAMVAFVGVAGAVLMFSGIHYESSFLRSSWALSRDYVSQLSTSNEPEIFLIDDVSGGCSSTEYVKLFSGYKGQLVRVNDLGWDLSCQKNSHIIIKSHANGDVTITSIIPKACGDHNFNSVFPAIDPKTTSFTRKLPAGTLHYDLSRPLETPKSTPDGNILRIELHHRMPGSIVLFASPLTLHYQREPLDSDTEATP